MIHVTAHAIDRFRERIADLPEETIRALLSAEPIRQAADFGANWVRIAGGHRICLRGHTVTTILPPDHFKRMVLREGLSRHGSHGQRRKAKHLRAGE